MKGAYVEVASRTVSSVGLCVRGLTPAFQALTIGLVFVAMLSATGCGVAGKSSTNGPTSGGGGSPSSTVQLSANPPNLSFGNVTVGSTTTQIVTLTNTGNTNVTISAVTVSGAGFSAGGGSNITLAPNQVINVVVNFNPSITGNVQGILSISSNAPNLQVTLTGQGTAPTGIHSVSLNWSPSTSVVMGYNVYRGLISGGPYARVNSAVDSATSYTDSGVTNGQTYFYVVTSVDSTSIESAYSNEVLVTIPSS